MPIAATEERGDMERKRRIMQIMHVLHRNMGDLWNNLEDKRKISVVVALYNEMGGGGLGEREGYKPLRDPSDPPPRWIDELEEEREASMSDGGRREKQYKAPALPGTPAVKEPYNPWWKGYVPSPVAEAMSRFAALFA